jgi:hypothetical protein
MRPARQNPRNRNAIRVERRDTRVPLRLAEAVQRCLSARQFDNRLAGRPGDTVAGLWGERFFRVSQGAKATQFADGELSVARLEPGNCPDQGSSLQRDSLPAGSLRLADLGYFGIPTLAGLARDGAYWITRIQSGTVFQPEGHPPGAALVVAEPMPRMAPSKFQFCWELKSAFPAAFSPFRLLRRLSRDDGNRCIEALTGRDERPVVIAWTGVNGPFSCRMWSRSD